MRAIRNLLLVPLLLVVTVSAPAGAANDDLPRTFAGCVAMGGEIRRVGDDVTCRHIVTGTMRTYFTATTECGEEVEAEIWSEIRYGVVTYAFAPERTVSLPDHIVEDVYGPQDPLSCLEDEGAHVPAPSISRR